MFLYLKAAVPVLLLCVLSLFTGCRFFSNNMEVEIVLPETPPVWDEIAERLEYRILWPDGTGDFASIEGLKPGERIGIRIMRKANFPVIAYPSLSGAELPSAGMMPSGGIYPGALETSGFDDRFVLTWEDGFLAGCMMDVVLKCVWAEGVNTERLRKQIDEESGGDPWFIDRRKLLRPIFYGRFYGGFAARAEVFPLEVTAGQAGWISGDPLFIPDDHMLLPEDSDEDKTSDTGAESPVTFLLPEGFHRFIKPDGSKLIDIMVDENGESAVSVQDISKER